MNRETLKLWKWCSVTRIRVRIFGQFWTRGSLVWDWLHKDLNEFCSSYSRPWSELVFFSLSTVQQSRTGTDHFVRCALIYGLVSWKRFAILYFWWLWNISGKASSSFWKTNIFFGLLLKMLKSWLLKWRNV